MINKGNNKHNELPAKNLQASQLVLLAKLKTSLASHVWGSLIYQKKAILLYFRHASEAAFKTVC